MSEKNFAVPRNSRWALAEGMLSPPFRLAQTPGGAVDRVDNKSSYATNTSYEPNTCEAKSAIQVDASEALESQAAALVCGDESETYVSNAWETTGLKGPPSASQRYISALESNVQGVQQKPSTNTYETVQTAQKALVADALDECREATLNAVRATLADVALKAGQSLKHSFSLPNGCKVSFTVEAALEKNATGQVALVATVKGSVEATLGAVSGSIEFSFSHSSTGYESVSFKACAFGGAGQQWGGLVGLEAKAGVCASYSDDTEAPAELKFDAVAKEKASIKLGDVVTWGFDAQQSYPLGRQDAPVDVIR